MAEERVYGDAYGPRPEERMVVRGWGSGKNHVAEISPDLLTVFDGFRKFDGFGFPVAVLCRIVLRQTPVVRMTDAAVSCTVCKRITGMTGVGPRWGPGGSRLDNPSNSTTTP